MMRLRHEARGKAGPRDAHLVRVIALPKSVIPVLVTGTHPSEMCAPAVHWAPATRAGVTQVGGRSRWVLLRGGAEDLDVQVADLLAQRVAVETKE